LTTVTAMMAIRNRVMTAPRPVPGKGFRIGHGAPLEAPRDAPEEAFDPPPTLVRVADRDGRRPEVSGPISSLAS
jgi:hypothetical protein